MCLRENTASHWRNRVTAGASNVLVVLLMHLVAYFTVSKFYSVESACSLQASERAKDRRRIGSDATSSKGLINLIDGPHVTLTGGQKHCDGIADVART